MTSLTTVLRQTTDYLVTEAIVLLPRVIAGVVFLVVAYLLVTIILRIVRASLSQMFDADSRLIVNLVVLITSIFLWFGVALTFLKIIGMGDIAASLGTSIGFIALGVAYATSNMIADTVAGVYLLRDPDFNPGDTIVTDAVTGTVTQIGLRKSRFHLDDGAIMVLANRDVEKKWTKQPADDS